MILSSAIYKILTGKENIDPHQFFHLSDNVHGFRGHSLKLFPNRLRLDLKKNFLQPKGHQRLEQSSSIDRRCNFGQLIQEPS